MTHLLRTVTICFTTAVLLNGLGASPAYAYLDPGTGSYVLQLVIAALLGVAFSVKIFWLRIKSFFNDLVSRKPKDS